MARLHSRLKAATAVAASALSAALGAAKTMQMPQTVHELTIAPAGDGEEAEVIAPGTNITAEILDAAGLSNDDVAELIEKGAIRLVDVLVAALEPAPEPEA